MEEKKFKVGDRVKFLGGDGPPVGTLGSVLKIDSDALVKFDGWKGGHGENNNNWWISFNRLEHFEKKFAAGQKVKIVKDTCAHHFPMGTVIELKSRYSGNPLYWNVLNSAMVVKEVDIEPIEEQKAPESSRFKLGMKCKIIGDSCYHHLRYGNVVELLEKNGDYSDAWWVIPGHGRYVREGDITEATAKDIEDAKKFIFMAGMKVKVIGNSCSHNFPIGSSIELKAQDGPTRWWVKDSSFYVNETDIEPIVPEKVIGEKYPRRDLVRGDVFSHRSNPDDCYKWIVKKTGTGKSQEEYTCKNFKDGLNSQTNPDSMVYFMGHVELDDKDNVIGEKTEVKPTEKDPDRYVYCENCRKPDRLRNLKGSSHKWRELTPEELKAHLGGKPLPTVTEKATPKRELIKLFGSTPTTLDYPPDKVKQPEKIDAYHCAICRADTRCEVHALSCPNSSGKVMGYRTPKPEKTITDKPNKKAYSRWFNEFDKKLMS